MSGWFLEVIEEPTVTLTPVVALRPDVPVTGRTWTIVDLCGMWLTIRYEVQGYTVYDKFYTSTRTLRRLSL